MYVLDELHEVDEGRPIEEVVGEVAARLLGRFRVVERGLSFIGEHFAVHEYLVDGEVSVKVIDVERPVETRAELAEMLRELYEAEGLHRQLKLRAHRPFKASTCRYSSAISNRYDYHCPRCLAETIWCELRHCEVCPQCHCEGCPLHEPLPQPKTPAILGR